MNTDKIEINSVVLNLRIRAAESKVFNAMAHIFAMRERARQQVTVTTLYNSMKKEGFDFSKKEYGKELAFLANLGLGRVVKDNKDRIQALKNIGVTLQSIGLASISKEDSLKHLRLHQQYVKLPKLDFEKEGVDERIKDFGTPVIQKSKQDKVQEVQQVIPQRPPAPVPKKVEAAPMNGYRAVLVIESDGKKREIILAQKVTADKILDLITVLQGDRNA